jgi:hypothetical protein
MKTQVKLFLTVLLMGLLVSSTFAKYGFDYDVRGGKMTGTVMGATCASYSWYDVGGNRIPDSDVICCDFKDNTYTGGINCPYAKPKRPTDITISYAMNWYVNDHIKIAVNTTTGDVEIVDYRNNLGKVIVSASQDMFGDLPTSIYVESINANTVRISYQKVTGNVI